MIDQAGLVRIAQLLNGTAQAQQLVLHLVGDVFEGYAPIPLDPSRWTQNIDGYWVYPLVSFVMHKRSNVEIKGQELRFDDGTLFYSEMYERPINLTFASQELQVIPQYKIEVKHD